GIIGFTAFLIRFFYFPDGIPITLDGGGIFWYANDLSISGSFPVNVNMPNNGWPTFLSIFFSFSNSDNMLHYMDLQRYLTVTISVITVIPVFILCRKFCGNGLSLLGTVFFVFQPRIIENSLLGISEPLFILLELSCLILFLQNNWKLKYLSFAFLALACLVRYEGIVLIVPLSFLLLFKNRNEKIIIPRFLICVSIFLLILLPMLFVRMDTLGYDGIFSHTAHNLEVYASGAQMVRSEAGLSLIKSAALAVFPIFFVFLPLGIFGFFRNRNFDKYVVLSFLVFLSLPIIYAAIREISEPRYFLTLFPILSLFSIYAVKEIASKLNKIKLILIIIGVIVLSLSIIYLEYTKTDHQHELDAYHTALEVHNRTFVINKYAPEDKYAHGKDDVFWGLGTFPVLESETERKVKSIRMFDYATCLKERELNKGLDYLSGCKKYEYTSLDEFIGSSKNQGLTHIVADKNPNRPEFLKDVFKNEEKFPYLIKIYDSSEHGYEYHLKIFRIDYEKFEETR
ncbi:MAG: glycosyltransferase family 39 protein, partial [Pelagibacterales bacterium]|nr:glycosyltransferase family 39 protein [Pelagibacterales bacterium]